MTGAGDDPRAVAEGRQAVEIDAAAQFAMAR